MRGANGGRWICALPLLLVACVSSHDIDAPSSPTDSSPDDVAGSAQPASKNAGAATVSAAQALACEKDPVDQFDGLHASLACAGLYADIAKKTPLNSLDEYVPGLMLWSDGAIKTRWVSLPTGKTIDASTPGDWVFPVGTKLFKEFKVGTHRVETRLWQKNPEGWQRATYVWDDNEKTAMRSDGGDITVDGEPYHVPTKKECDACHAGRNERALGFEQIALSVADAAKYTLADLVKHKQISPVPDATTMQIMDDGYGMVRVAGWMHMNCGVSCHNSNPNAMGHQTKLRMRLDPSELDGRSATEYDAFKTTVGVPATTPKWGGKIRIVPGDPEASLLYTLITSRGGGENEQMPPLASRIVDTMDSDLVAEWIRNLPTTANGAAK